MSVKLSRRLDAACEMVTSGSVVADVGCDHAFLSIALVSGGRAEEAYACDVNRGPLGRAKEHIKEAGLEEKIHTVLSDGLTALEAPVDSIVICGMGGSLIISILEKSIEKARSAKELILSPQSDVKKVRVWLYENGFSLIEERAVFDAGKYYVLIKVKPEGNASGWDLPENVCDEDLAMEYGPYLISHRDPVFIEYIKKRIAALTQILQGIDKENHRYKELEKILKWDIIFIKEKNN
ncbi:MAG: SAM-dependent methyltransferase [Lachnospiraceae bacterium]|uniref:SAM-dependent methyltransferase n=1 Tax=Candidatus Weimeria bifida TaxID=2599074 RepID=A0A6N7IYZ1_9FIRM|nr:SAM-dependent methyltransferase [Candidatus Weimeria bifida]RRF97091.1 MAG: SAM-dependent methyltransferase [Lachnospiraceae bacterium]